MERLIFHSSAVETTTMRLHVENARKLDLGITDQYLPHKGFFHALILLKRLTGLAYGTAAILFLSLLATFTAAVIYGLLRTQVPSYPNIVLLVMTAILMTAGAIYLPFFNKAVYFGQGSPNMWHNGTVIFVKPFVIISFYMVATILGDSQRRSSIQYCVLAAFVMLITVYVKPSYVLVLLPALAMYVPIKTMLTGQGHRKDFVQFPVVCLIILLVALPSFLTLLYQYLDYSSGRDARKTAFEFLTVWRYFTPNVFVSILITIAFPLFVLVNRFDSAVRNDYLMMAWIVTFIGIAQFALLIELSPSGGIVWYSKSANWIGGYLMGLSVLFIFSGIEYLKWLKTFDKNSLTARLNVLAASLLLGLHMFSGGYYLFELMKNHETQLIWYS